MVHLTDAQGMTPLHFAADRGHNEVAQLLIANGADVDALDSGLQTPLMYAVECEHLVSITVGKAVLKTPR